MITRDQAHRDAMRASIDSVAGRLQEVLGQRITAYAVGIKDPRTIGRWAGDGGQKPREATEKRLRELFEITQILLGRETPETVRAWLMGSNPLLDDRSPLELLHSESQPPVHRTAATDANAGYLTVASAAEDFVRDA
jgi:hypothetical protein